MSALKSLTSYQQQALKILISDTTESATISGTNLAKRIGLKQKNGVEGANMRSIIHSLRVKGFPVCANGRGYFYAKTDEQLSKFIVKLQARVISQEEALKGLKESFHNVGSAMFGMLVKGDPSLPPNTIKFTVTKAIRTPNGVAFKDLEVGPDGQPIVPPGIELI